MTAIPDELELREVRESDLAEFFEHQRDSAASRMAAFVGRDPTDREAFDAPATDRQRER